MLDSKESKLQLLVLAQALVDILRAELELPLEGSSEPFDDVAGAWALVSRHESLRRRLLHEGGKEKWLRDLEGAVGRPKGVKRGRLH